MIISADSRNQAELKQRHTVFVHQLELFYDAVKLTLTAHAVNGTMLLLFLQGAVAQDLLLGWYAGLLMLLLYRGYTLYGYRHETDRVLHARRWYWHAMIGVALASLVWGAAGYLLFTPGDLYHQALLAFVIAGMTAGGITVLASFSEAALLFISIVLIPFVFRLFQAGTEDSMQMGALVALFLLLLMISARRIHRTVVEGLNLHYQRQQAEETIIRQAFYDELTELPNRRMLQDRLYQDVARAIRHGVNGAVLFLDLDNFKHINDSLGHSVGDELLIKVASRLRHHLREEDTAARLGGDEFVVLLTDLEGDEARISSRVMQVADQVRMALANPFEIAGHELHVSTSIGVAIYPADAENVDDLLKHADTAMYRAKERGRNLVQFFLPSMQVAVNERLALEHDLRKAISSSGLLLYYQPQVHRDGRVFGAEALLRWQREDGSMVSPAEFIPVAEETGLIYLIGGWVLEEACRNLAELSSMEAGCDLVSIAINVSPKQFRQRDFADHVVATLKRFGVDSGRLELEVTESVLVTDYQDTAEKMRQLRELGVRFSIDDFGTGYSSMAYLKNLPLDAIKIDQSFVRDLTTDPSDASIVETIIVMSRHLGLKVIAEGVETEQTLDVLKAYGCDNYQGYLFGRPMPFEAFKQRLTEESNTSVDRGGG
jgi:diguanylate cyclase (GGDEF)-like protein